MRWEPSLCVGPSTRKSGSRPAAPARARAMPSNTSPPPAPVPRAAQIKPALFRGEGNGDTLRPSFEIGPITTKGLRSQGDARIQPAQSRAASDLTGSKAEVRSLENELTAKLPSRQGPMLTRQPVGPDFRLYVLALHAADTQPKHAFRQGIAVGEFKHEAKFSDQQIGRAKAPRNAPQPAQPPWFAAVIDMSAVPCQSVPRSLLSRTLFAVCFSTCRAMIPAGTVAARKTR